MFEYERREKVSSADADHGPLEQLDFGVRDRLALHIPPGRRPQVTGSWGRPCGAFCAGQPQMLRQCKVLCCAVLCWSDVLCCAVWLVGVARRGIGVAQGQ